MARTFISERNHLDAVHFSFHFNTNVPILDEVNNALAYMRTQTLNMMRRNGSIPPQPVKRELKVLNELHGTDQYVQLKDASFLSIKVRIKSHRCSTSDCTVEEMPLIKQEYYDWSISSKVCQLMEAPGSKYHKQLKECLSHNTGLHQQLFKPLRSADQLLVLHKEMEKSSKVFLLLVQQAVINENTGYLSTDHHYFVHSQCFAEIHTGYSSDVPHRPSDIPVHDEVFVLTQIWSSFYYHWLIEALPRLIIYREFLLTYTHIKIHIGTSNSFAVSHFAMLGITERRIISGHARASLAYIPQGGGCGHAHFVSAPILSNFFVEHIHKINQTLQQNSIVLIQRSSSRRLIQHSELITILDGIAKVRGYYLKVFSDSPLPPLTEAMAIFHSAVMVVGPHGAGLANLIYSRPATAVVEVLCSTELNLCYQDLSSVLGMRYHGVASLVDNGGGGGCDNGMVANLTEIQRVVEFYLDASIVSKTR